jgi:mono/diheme cytochrome c family protein
MTTSSTRLLRSLGGSLFMIGSVVMLAASSAQAQNIDQDKSAPQLYAASCATCHRSPGALAKGRSGNALSSFLQEHYTASAANARAIAAYLASVDAGPGQPKAARRAKRKPRPDAAPAQ